jgi:hypothetical protein
MLRVEDVCNDQHLGTTMESSATMLGWQALLKPCDQPICSSTEEREQRLTTISLYSLHKEKLIDDSFVPVYAVH